jgi:hypothetical protein
MARHQRTIDALCGEAARAGLTVERVDEIDLAPATLHSTIGAFLGHHEPQQLVVMTVKARDGARWAYVQPFSSVALPGEHHFALRGAPSAPLVAAGPGWLSRAVQLRIVLAALLAITFWGIPLAILLLVAFPRPAKLIGSHEARIVNASGVLDGRLFGRRFGAGNFVLPWVMQLVSRGDGTSRFVCRAPETCSSRVFAAPVADFAWALDVARAVQGSLSASAPAQRPVHALGYASLVDRWEPGLHPPISLGPPPPTALGALALSGAVSWQTWVPIVLGLPALAVGLFFAFAGAQLVLHPQAPAEVNLGWGTLAFSMIACALPSFLAIAGGIARFAWKIRSLRRDGAPGLRMGPAPAAA